jgi:hypothetical protein
MANRGWDGGGGGEQVSSTARQSGDGTDCADGDPFLVGSKLADPGGAPDDTMGGRSDVFEVPGQMSTAN